VGYLPGTGYFNAAHRWRFAEVLNPMYGIQGRQFADYRQSKNIGLIDAGLSFNLPFPPLNDHNGSRPERKPDVVIFIDASADTDSAGAFNPNANQAWPTGITLKAVEKYARDNGIAFPEIPELDQENIVDGSCRIFNRRPESNPNQPVPTVIYLPIIKKHC